MHGMLMVSNLVKYSEKGKLVERQGRKAMDLKDVKLLWPPSCQDSEEASGIILRRGYYDN